MFYEAREMGIRHFGVWSNPPLRDNPVIHYDNINTLLNSRGVSFPSATSGYVTDWPTTRVLSFHFGVQQNIGFGTVVGASWTWSKAMDYGDTNTGQISALIAPRVWNYDKAGFEYGARFVAQGRQVNARFGEYIAARRRAAFRSLSA